MRIQATFPLLICHLPGTCFLLALLLASPLMAQKSKPIPSREPVPMTPMQEADAPIAAPAYTIRPSLPINPATDAGNISHYAENGSPSGGLNRTSIEPADSVFVFGASNGSETRKIAKVDQNGWAVVLEDVAKPVLYLRFQRLKTEYIEVKLYAENGSLMFDKTVANLPLGTQVEMGYREWPTGVYSLHVQLDDGLRWVKQIRMGGQVSTY
jgi:hypothetical protein